MAFVIRSMSTTDFSPARRCGTMFIPAQKSTPYHIFLREPAKHAGAYWAGFFEAQRFDTEEAAQAEAARISLLGYDIAPVNFTETGFPNYWDRRSAAKEA